MKSRVLEFQLLDGLPEIGHAPKHNFHFEVLLERLLTIGLR